MYVPKGVGTKKKKKARSFDDQPPSKHSKLDKQVSFHCTQEFYGQIQAEKVRRALTIQEMILKALSDYFKTPSSDAPPRVRMVANPAPSRHGRAGYDLDRWTDLCAKYFHQMPRAKRAVLEEFIILDLKHYASARLKARD